MSFTEVAEVPHGFNMNFKDALRIVSESVFIKLAVPRFLMDLTQRLREVDVAFKELEVVSALRIALTFTHADAPEKRST